MSRWVSAIHSHGVAAVSNALTGSSKHSDTLERDTFFCVCVPHLPSHTCTCRNTYCKRHRFSNQYFARRQKVKQNVDFGKSNCFSLWVPGWLSLSLGVKQSIVHRWLLKWNRIPAVCHAERLLEQSAELAIIGKLNKGKLFIFSFNKCMNHKRVVSFFF